MRVWGTIMLTIGIILGALIFLPVFIGVLITEKDTQNVNYYLTFTVIFFGVPSLLLILYGRKLRRKGQLAAEENFRQQQLRNGASEYAAFGDRARQAVRRPAMETMQNKHNVPQTAPKLFVPKVTAPPKTVICRNCGASKNMVVGQEAACDYCSTILKA
ncbi:hypothetical protein B1748_00875 [Paenibacillus sp. MY03]|uniref:hypothetical protein n=1 Tax=Paenibacillus sp. MY03 TaxID=302980 RepID=UPI000B3CE3AB|nr:hypothetical protein [Paenibacillus sp. MY03]OUS78662.1 hypothetical protein B1748_00875 [Paenibacillus sp. MY03]